MLDPARLADYLSWRCRNLRTDQTRTQTDAGEDFPIKPLEEELNALAKRTIEPRLLKEVIVKMGTVFEVISNVALIAMPI